MLPRALRPAPRGRAGAALALALLAVACDDGGGGPDRGDALLDAAPVADAAPREDARPLDAAPPDAAPPDAALPERGEAWRLEVGDARVDLRPTVFVDGAWRGGGADGPCVWTDDRLSCPAGPGDATLTFDDEGPRAWFRAAASATVEGLALDGAARLPGARAWLSNGFQSWSQSGVLALGGPRGDATVRQAIRRVGDAEVIRTGEVVSWWYGAVGGGATTLVVGAPDARTFKPWVQVHRAAAEGDPDALRLRLGCGWTGERIAVAAGDVVAGEAWLVTLADAPEAGLGAFADALGRRARRGAPAEAGWNSWYELWDAVDEAAVRANADLARAHLAPRLPADAPPLRITVDDGWQLAWGDWRPNAKFPAGLDGLAADLKGDGLEVGVWLAPLLVDPALPIVAEHPDWFVRGAIFPHAKHGPLRVLDVTHPDAAAHLQAAIRQVVGWGYDFLKIDFLFAGLMEGGRHVPTTGLASYHTALRLIREAAGEDVVLLAVGAPGTPSLPYVDAWRVGGDIAVEPFDVRFPFLPNQLRSVAARWPFCRVTLCDADPVVLRTLSREEVAFGAFTVAAAGGALFLSDDLRALDAARYDWGLDPATVANALASSPAVPEDFFPADAPASLVSALSDHLNGTDLHVVPRRWRAQDGTRYVVNPAGDPLLVEGIPVPPHGVAVLPDR